MKNIQWVLKSAFVSLFEQRGWLFKSLLIFFTLSAALTFLEFIFVEDALPDDALRIGQYVYLIFFLQSLLLAFVAINVHRILLKSERLYVEPDFLLSKTSSNIRYLIRVFWMFVVVSLTITLLVFLSVPLFGLWFEQSGVILFGVYGLFVLVAFSALYYVSPVFLVLPCIAYQSVMTFGDAFKLGRNYRFLMFVVVIVMPALIQFVLSGIIELMFFSPSNVDDTQSIMGENYSIVEHSFYNIVYFATTVISVAFLSAAYARIKSLELKG